METITEGLVTAESARAATATASESGLVSPSSVVSHVTRLIIAGDAGEGSKSDGQNGAPGGDSRPAGVGVRGLKVPIVTITSDTASDGDGEELVQTAVLTFPADGTNGPSADIRSECKPPSGSGKDAVPSADGAVTAASSATTGADPALSSGTAGDTAAASVMAGGSDSAPSSPPAISAGVPPSGHPTSTSTDAGTGTTITSTSSTTSAATETSTSHIGTSGASTSPSASPGTSPPTIISGNSKTTANTSATNTTPTRTTTTPGATPAQCPGTTPAAPPASRARGYVGYAGRGGGGGGGGRKVYSPGRIAIRAMSPPRRPRLEAEVSSHAPSPDITRSWLTVSGVASAAPPWCDCVCRKVVLVVL